VSFFQPYEFKGSFYYAERTTGGVNELLYKFKDSNFGKGKIKALLVDSPLAEMLSSRWPCSTYALADPISNFNYGYLFREPDLAEVNSLNLALFTFKESSE
jgi:hypothetical protein